MKPDVAVAANGEIYNFRKLYETLPEPVQTQSDSDSEVLMHLYRAFGPEFVPQLDGMFAFVLVDQVCMMWRLVKIRCLCLYACVSSLLSVF